MPSQRLATETIDRREKLLAYQSLDSLKEYVLVTQDRIHVEVFRRDNVGEWWLDIYSGNETVDLQAVGMMMSLAAVYVDVF